RYFYASLMPVSLAFPLSYSQMIRGAKACTIRYHERLW
ncbi:MAG: hypothetical protein QOF30_1518, partial [Acidimicrobiaceae bacterium]|nr:hypothetical protein [Acidimicrobiaceae bacterium]